MRSSQRPDRRHGRRLPSSAADPAAFSRALDEAAAHFAAGRLDAAAQVYRRLERDALIHSHWESQSIADAEQRPARKYYKLTAAGRTTLEASRKRYPLLERLIPTEEARSV